MKSSNKESADDSHVQIKLFTKQEQYAVPDTPYSIPAISTTDTLNTLLNALLKESSDSENDVDFDFLISNEFLRVNLNEHLQERSISSENVIDIEYVERHPAPEPQDCLLHDDWVSSVQACGNWILTGSYDGTVNIWTTKGKKRLTIPAHKEYVKGVSWISFEDNAATFVSVSSDQTANIWQWDHKTNDVECVAVCKGHEAVIESVAVNPDKSRMATGSWDSYLKVWSASLQDTDSGESNNKRSKGEKAKVRTPLMTLQGHKEVIVSVRWMDEHTIATASWDHTIKLWDAALGGIKSEIVANKALFNLDYSKLNNMFITCSADRHIRLYDPRSSEGSIVKQTYTSHTQGVQTVCWSQTEEHLFMSGGYDNQVKLWDSRSPKAPLYDLLGHDDNVLSCDWTNPKYLISGGKDNTVRIFKSRHAIK